MADRAWLNALVVRCERAACKNQWREDVYQNPDSNRRLGTLGHAVQHGIDLAMRIGAKVMILTVSPPFHVFTTDTQMIEDTAAQYQARMQRRARKSSAPFAHLAQAAGVVCEAVHVEHEHPYRAIIDTAASRGCDLIAMGSHGRRGISAIVLGSKTVKVLTHSKIPVIVHH